MPRLERITVRITTGDEGPGESPSYTINGFTLPFDQVDGGTAPGQTLEATGFPGSVPHSLLLAGPSEGNWEIARLEAEYEPEGESPYTVAFAPLILDDAADLNIWQPRPPVEVDV